ncbi:MAG: DIP1984 family protein [Selenomonadaceae bacterium]|nr:DIP1984 family protein [Selenomonadaceae bacterium]
MKLAEALQERADIQKRLSQLRGRLLNNAKVQEGEKPVENPAELLQEMDGMILRLEELILHINMTNARTADNGETLTSLLAKRECLQKKVGLMRDFLDRASELVERSAYTEIKVHSTVSVPEKRKELDALSKDLRNLDSRIQQLNWLTELQ